MRDMNEEEYQKELARLKERERSLMRQLDLARATIAFQAYGILAPNSPKREDPCALGHE
jgi:hypothetical protein